MSFIASHKALFKKGGTAVSFTAEATSVVTSDQVFQITDADKRIWDIDPATTFTFYEDAVAIADSEIEYIDLMQGIVKFVNADKTGAITADGKYIPVATISYANEGTFNVSQEVVDATTFASLVSDNDFRSKVATIKDVSLSLNGFYETSSLFFDTLNNAEDVLIECSMDGATEKLVGWFKSETIENSLGISDLVGQSLSFQGNDKTYNGGAYPRRGYFVFN